MVWILYAQIVLNIYIITIGLKIVNRFYIQYSLYFLKKIHFFYCFSFEYGSIKVIH